MHSKSIRATAAENGRANLNPSLFHLMSAAESRRARAIAYEAALAVIG